MNSKGFTVIELVVSLAIIALLSAITMPIYREASQDIFVQEEARKLVRAIESTRAMAIASKDFGIGDISQERDYRIRITENYYEIFISLNGIEHIIQKENFRKGVIANTGFVDVVISFSPPDPIIKFFYDGTESDDRDLQMQINIGHRRYVGQATWWQWIISVNRAGLVGLKKTDGVE